jgi:hypothetical protein
MPELTVRVAWRRAGGLLSLRLAIPRWLHEVAGHESIPDFRCSNHSGASRRSAMACTCWHSLGRPCGSTTISSTNTPCWWDSGDRLRQRTHQTEQFVLDVPRHCQSGAHRTSQVRSKATTLADARITPNCVWCPRARAPGLALLTFLP